MNKPPLLMMMTRRKRKELMMIKSQMKTRAKVNRWRPPSQLKRKKLPVPPILNQLTKLKIRRPLRKRLMIPTHKRRTMKRPNQTPQRKRSLQKRRLMS